MTSRGRAGLLTGKIVESSDLMNVHHTMSFFSPLMTAVFKPKLIHKKSLQEDSLGLMMNWPSLQSICCDEQRPLWPGRRPKILFVFDQKDKSELWLLFTQTDHHLSDSWNICLPPLTFSHTHVVCLARSQYPARKYSYGDMWSGGKLLSQHSRLPWGQPYDMNDWMIDFKQPAET